MAFFKRKVSNTSNHVDKVDKSSGSDVNKISTACITKNPVVNVDEIYVATTSIISSYDDGSGWGPRAVDWYFLVTFRNEQYYELFSNKKLKMKKDTDEDDVVVLSFDEPYIKNVEPLKEHLDTPYIIKNVESLKEYLRDKSTENLEIEILFDFITNMNVLNSLGALKNEEEPKK
jgi:hypothetical protein